MPGHAQRLRTFHKYGIRGIFPTLEMRTGPAPGASTAPNFHFLAHQSCVDFLRWSGSCGCSDGGWKPALPDSPLLADVIGLGCSWGWGALGSPRKESLSGI
uniref:Uncharacterized protein n=1 Tax=Rousettus aegyptiacus TaxID=9407 RepID=A0A7J8FKA1_ROUAE|nr:hypothetical protein HJG63_011998 [Rousettus aegyptiacus]